MKCSTPELPRRPLDNDKTRHVGVRVPWDLYETIGTLADQEGRSWSNQAIRMWRQHPAVPKAAR
jgi:hypothetical protein